ncbi:helix-turn-helix DNA-binding protein [Gordonia phage BiggityBass]|nr:helix-turn-helix DNA-binding protein [Gordonia phage BiggityBass]
MTTTEPRRRALPKDPETGQHTYNRERAERVARLTRQGLSAADIAAQLRVTVRTVVRDRQRTGVCGKLPPRLSDEKLAQARQLLADGASYREAARTVGCDPANLRRRLPGYGWPPGQWPEGLNPTIIASVRREK